MIAVGKKVWDFFENIAKRFTFWIFSLFKITITQTQWDMFVQFIKFGLVGVGNTLISYVVYAFFVYLGYHYIIGSIIGFVVSVLNSFYWNNKYVFKEKDGEKRSLWKACFKTFLSYASSGLILTNILLVVWVDLLHISEYLAPIINLVITIPINFLINKLWAFKGEKDEKKC